MRARGRHRATGALLGALVMALTGCGISAQAEPSVLSPSPSPSASSPSPSPTEDLPKSTIYLVFAKDGTLRTRERSLPSNPTPAQLVEALEADVSPDESDSGLTTGFRGSRVVSSEAGAPQGRVTVEVPTEFLTEERLAFGQIVLTLTRLSYVDQVRFVRDGQAIDYPDGAGRLISRPAVRSDYTSLLAG